MPALAITIAFSFLLGCLLPVADQKASAIFNKQAAGGAFLFIVAVMLTFGLSIFAIALIATALGTYTSDNHRVVLAGYMSGVAVCMVVRRARGYRR